jgi:hypothetical protein
VKSRKRSVSAAEELSARIAWPLLAVTVPTSPAVLQSANPLGKPKFRSARAEDPAVDRHRTTNDWSKKNRLPEDRMVRLLL